MWQLLLWDGAEEATSSSVRRCQRSKVCTTLCLRLGASTSPLGPGSWRHDR